MKILISGVVGFIGRLTPRKGVEYFIKAIPKVLKRCPYTMFVIVGSIDSKDDEPYGRYLIELGKNLNIEQNILYVGSVHGEAYLRWLAALDTLVFTSPIDASPMVVLEAMAMAKPVVVASEGGAKEEIIDGVTGIYVKPKDVDGIADAIVQIVSNKEIASAMGLAGRKHVEEKFDETLYVSTIESIYKNLLSRY